MAAIHNLKHKSSYCSFSFDYKAGQIMTTAPFDLNDTWKNCQLKISVLSFDYEIDEDGCLVCACDVSLTLKFDEDSKSSRPEKIKFNIAFGKKDKGCYLFSFLRVTGNKCHFQREFEDVRIPNRPVYSVHIKIIFKEQDRDEYYDDADSDSDMIPEDNMDTSDLVLKNESITNDNQLMKNMNDIFLNETYSDIKLAVEDKIFNVHKIVLYTRNDVFAKMIEDMMRNGTDTISLPGWDSAVVEELLKFIYTGKCDVTKNPCELFKLAHFLLITELQQLCKNYLISNIQVRNLNEILELTKHSEYKLHDLRKLADTFIKENESILQKIADIKENYIHAINLDNVMFVLKFSKENGQEDLLALAIKFICCNYKEFLQNEKNSKILALDPDLMSRVFEYLLENQKVTSCHLCPKAD